MEKTTNLLFTEIKRGSITGKKYELTAGEFITIVKDKDHDGYLNIGVEPIFGGGDIIGCTTDKFYDLPIIEQLNMCCEREGDNYASSITYSII